MIYHLFVLLSVKLRTNRSNAAAGATAGALTATGAPVSDINKSLDDDKDSFDTRIRIR
jgi:hypothetical protein